MALAERKEKELAIAKRTVAEAEPASEGATILAMIDRMMAMPEIPIERFDQFFTLHQRVQADQSKRAFNAAFAEMQPEIPATIRHGKITHGEGSSAKVRSTYAKYEDIVEDIAPILAKHGFSLRHRTNNEPGKVIITGILAHREGHAEETTLELPADTSGSKNAVQAIGSSVSYGKRYTASALLNLVSRGEDDDGVAACASTQAAPAPSGVISEAQCAELISLLEATKSNKEKFCALYGIAGVAQLPAAKFFDAKGRLVTKQGTK